MLSITRNISPKKDLFSSGFSKMFAEFSSAISGIRDLYKSYNGNVILLESKVLFLERLITPPPFYSAAVFKYI